MNVGISERTGIVHDAESQVGNFITANDAGQNGERTKEL